MAWGSINSVGYPNAIETGPSKYSEIASNPNSLAANVTKVFLYTLYSTPASLKFFLN